MNCSLCSLPPKYSCSCNTSVKLLCNHHLPIHLEDISLRHTVNLLLNDDFIKIKKTMMELKKTTFADSLIKIKNIQAETNERIDNINKLIKILNQKHLEDDLNLTMFDDIFDQIAQMNEDDKFIIKKALLEENLKDNSKRNSKINIFFCIFLLFFCLIFGKNILSGDVTAIGVFIISFCILIKEYLRSSKVSKKDLYFGLYLNGKRHGKGIMKYINGDEYEGE